MSSSGMVFIPNFTKNWWVGGWMDCENVDKCCEKNVALSLQLTQIPEGLQAGGVTGCLYQQTRVSTTGDDCERLCLEADQLLDKSRATEEARDLETALVLCHAAVGKARAAMDAPYNNPQTLTFARMKHNTCVMRVRSLHRRLMQTQQGSQSNGTGKDGEHS